MAFLFLVGRRGTGCRLLRGFGCLYTFFTISPCPESLKQAAKCHDFSAVRLSPFAMTSCSGRRHRCRCTPPPAAAAAAVTTHHLAILLFRMSILTFCQCDAFPKLFEPKSHKVARLTAELAALEAERLSKYVVVFGYEVSSPNESGRFFASTIYCPCVVNNQSSKISSKISSTSLDSSRLCRYQLCCLWQV